MLDKDYILKLDLFFRKCVSAGARLMHMHGLHRLQEQRGEMLAARLCVWVFWEPGIG